MLSFRVALMDAILVPEVCSQIGARSKLLQIRCYDGQGIKTAATTGQSHQRQGGAGFRGRIFVSRIGGPALRLGAQEPGGGPTIGGNVVDVQGAVGAKKYPC